MTPEIQELKRLAEAAMPSLSEMMVVEFAEFSSVRDQDGASIAQVRGGVPYFDKEVAAYIAAASPSTILALIEENERLRGHIGVLLDNEPDELAADGGVTVLDVWRKEAVERFRIPVLTEDRTALEGVKK